MYPYFIVENRRIETCCSYICLQKIMLTNQLTHFICAKCKLNKLKRCLNFSNPNYGPI